MPDSKVALVTGVTGQDGSFLAEFLVAKGYEVHGIVRRQSVQRYDNLTDLIAEDAIHLHEADLTDLTSLQAVVTDVEPDELYALGSMSHVGTSFKQPELTMDVTGTGALRVLEAVRQAKRPIRVYVASSSEMFGNALRWEDSGGKLNEGSPFRPESPYGVAKLAAHHLARVYRESYGMFVSCGVLFNHESERRGQLFLTRKVTRAVARMKCGLQVKVVLGNLDAIRDWGYAPEYVDAMWRMLQQDKPDDFVIATGEGHSVRDWLHASWQAAGLPMSDLAHRVEVHESEVRPSDVWRLVGDPAKAQALLGWDAKTKFNVLVGRMVKHDLKLAAVEASIHV